ncbi:SDR family NAD(P)-dependent oxidoreductase [Erythrobacter arachoides]|uniref:SDR family NAD(P)-dependent oxidoreductase n=1 Tax=Aurantiacibacter arachoides TaxID=1850444 RepID=A0A844ZZK1_9SPHN|nr:SDR family NAD(P)-dependent oxidoreductase [Aurantiacibacter arachoides]MXO92680.1 SDR family NAD(P)-dependent oxidoreductase [Aurantiacibacter arachoides]GGD55283.1 SDR family oxidoreductase [Aurantiacibacter arachoides]
MSLADLVTQPPRAIVVGSSGGIGGALEGQLRNKGFVVTGLSRSPPPGTDHLAIDLTRECTIEAAATQLRDQAPFSLIMVCTGLLHGDDMRPEKALRDLDQSNLMQLFAVNAVGPALVAKHFVPLLPKGSRSIFAALSARVGSIGDNRLGGWYGYRASKAALNMLIKTLSIELARTHPEAICVGLHPGTVDTGLSKPFQRNVRPDRLFSADTAAGHLLHVLDRLVSEDSGRCLAWDGTAIAP